MGAYEEQDVARQWFDVADAAALLLDAQGRVTGWTRDAQRLLNYSAAEVVGGRAGSLLSPEDALRVPDLARRCREDGGWSGLLTVARRNGEQVKVMVRITSAQEAPGPSRWLVLLSEMGDAPGWAMSRRVLEQMVAGSPVGIAIVDAELRYVWSNAALEQFGGGPARTRLGRRLADVQPGLNSRSIEAQMRRVLDTGEPVVGYEHVGLVRSAPHRETAHMMSFTRLEDEDGHPMGVYYTVVDVSERHRARQRLDLLDRAGEHIGRSLDIMQTAQELADVVVPTFADFVSVDLLEPVLAGAELTAGPPDGELAVPLRRAGQQSVNENVPEATFAVGDVAAYVPGSPPMRVLATALPWRQARLDPLARDWATDGSGARRSTFLELGLHSVMIVPVHARGVTLGVTTFFRHRRQDPFDEDDLTLAEDLVSRAAVCVDNARRYTRERDAALVLQRSLLPHRLPEQDAVEVAACYRPADELTGLGGDWYDLITLSGGRVALVVGEVPGHGIDAAAAMGRLRTAVRTLAALDLPPEEVLAHLDDLVARSAREEGSEAGTQEGIEQSVGSACLYVVYDPVDGQCTMAAAGHPAPAVVLPDGEVTFVDLPQGAPLGVGGAPFESVELALAAGSTLALHTDGLLAREDGDASRSGEGEGEGGDGERPVETDRDRLRRALEGRVDSLDLQCRTVVDVLTPDRPHDDVALLMARTRVLGTEQVADWDLPADPAAVADARKTAARLLTEWGLDELAFTTELVVSELVTNAIRYAEGPIRLRLIRERALVCEVFDGGATAPHLRHPRTTDEGGRGLLLVSQFTQRWGTRFVPEGKIIWAEQPLTEQPPQPDEQ
ncbi:SpoIIE family protein phosphatase [Streptomyces sp. Y7]|uniref:SpoIIE family protein phosphatase n=1 Tax=Streptomyces sp. Y7 TaxID=3342392 RepID=UPI003717847F